MKTQIRGIGVLLLLAAVLPARENRKPAPNDQAPVTCGNYRTIHSEVLVEYRVYEDEGHVPFPSVYGGLKWIYAQEKATAR